MLTSTKVLPPTSNPNKINEYFWDGEENYRKLRSGLRKKDYGDKNIFV